ncbi:SdpI family protein [Spirosoma sp.]|uniref:SdpI family protein n=1 Tax=Spirosoma sp. TaxID=1899569 RepID=UPI0026321867|nr:SdpI family protein [Spirosoma sp.]MCX6216604.1 SdpI family protein [Spirosoma sp.]
MKTNTFSIEILILALLVAPLIYLGLIWNQLPAEITTHYDLAGKANGWMTKEQAALYTVGISLLLYLLLRYLPMIDPKKQLQTANYQKLRLMFTLLISAIMSWVFYMGNHSISSENFVSVLMVIISVTIAGVGNYITTIKPNWFVGIRTPWTLDNEIVWRKTHRLGGRLMVAGGIVGAVLAFLLPLAYKVGITVSILLLVSFMPVVYSYICFRQEKAHRLN